MNLVINFTCLLIKEATNKSHSYRIFIYDHNFFSYQNVGVNEQTEKSSHWKEGVNGVNRQATNDEKYSDYRQNEKNWNNEYQQEKY